MEQRFQALPEFRGHIRFAAKPSPPRSADYRPVASTRPSGDYSISLSPSPKRNCLCNRAHCDTSNGQPSSHTLHKFRTMSGKCQSAGWRSGKTTCSYALETVLLANARYLCLALRPRHSLVSCCKIAEALGESSGFILGSDQLVVGVSRAIRKLTHTDSRSGRARVHA